MANAVQVTLVAKHQGQGHKHAVLKCGDVRVELPVTSPETDHSGLALDWQQVPRPDDKPLLGDAGGQLHVMKQDVTIARKNGSPVEDLMVLLVNMSRDPNNTVKMAHYGWLEAGPWRMTDIQFHTQMRKLGTNQVTRTAATITLTEAVRDPGPSATKKKNKGKNKSRGKGREKWVTHPATYVVRAGDTLPKIAARFYGDANDWQDIAKANGIRNPRKLKVGQKLKLP